MKREPDKLDLVLLRERDHKTLQRWFDRYVDDVYGYVYFRVGRDESLAADVVQETFLQALERLEAFDPRRGTMVAWLTTLSRNPITRALQATGRTSIDQRWQKLDAYLRRRFEHLATELLPSDILEKRETVELVEMTLASIPGNYRTVLTLYYHRGLSLRDIAARTRRTEGAVKVLLHRARQAFKEAFVRLASSELWEGDRP